MALFWLSDEAWGAIQPHLPRSQPGARRVDDRRVNTCAPCSSAPCAWETCLAISSPIVVASDTDASLSGESTPPLWHIDAVGGASTPSPMWTGCSC